MMTFCDVCEYYHIMYIVGNEVAALALLAYMVPDARSKADHEKIIFFCPVSPIMCYEYLGRRGEGYIWHFCGYDL